MPGVILLVVLGLVLGATVRPASRAYAIVGALAVLDIASLIWSVADGKGDDPGWLPLMGVAGAAIALLLVRVGSTLRRRAHA
jgi:hypothetical protein